MRAVTCIALCGLASCSGQVDATLSELRSPVLSVAVRDSEKMIELHLSTQVSGRAGQDVGATCAVLKPEAVATLDGTPMQRTQSGAPEHSVKGFVTSCEDIIFVAPTPEAAVATTAFEVRDASAVFEMELAALTTPLSITPNGPVAPGQTLELTWAPASDLVVADDLGESLSSPDGGFADVQPSFGAGTIAVPIPQGFATGVDELDLSVCFSAGLISCDGGVGCDGRRGCTNVSCSISVE